jgi:hypothetical protein
MHRRRASIAAAAIFAIGAAFAAEPTSLRADWGEVTSDRGQPWSPGKHSVMSAHEQGQAEIPPPR